MRSSPLASPDAAPLTSSLHAVPAHPSSLSSRATRDRSARRFGFSSRRPLAEVLSLQHQHHSACGTDARRQLPLSAMLGNSGGCRLIASTGFGSQVVPTSMRRRMPPHRPPRSCCRLRRLSRTGSWPSPSPSSARLASTAALLSRPCRPWHRAVLLGVYFSFS
ncbi:hypothetical protein PR202_ga31322 [Eleusine coracana subsp. coracana]|uniref:Uncharacterized protein n=1 Tax=Eleusine coracana subsp. coracana TaxID=191504 RepID=A0AAV5DRJ7_ELECO|nr:hypothetical protein PR202_ga31322 [Eleusine coracana subsp. coracana]